ncbi:hypothetical protein Droror1_Dr00005990 [Drosera rotundifolia]
MVAMNLTTTTTMSRESCGSFSSASSAAAASKNRQKYEVYSEILRRLREGDELETKMAGFEDELWSHFTRLPTRYALDVNVERAEDVLTHKRLLQLARDPANRPVFDVRLMQVLPPSELASREDGDPDNAPITRPSIHPPPAFGSSANLEALALEDTKVHNRDGNSRTNGGSKKFRPMHEITFSTDDKPKVLSQLTSLLAEIGLNIQEAHAFSTTDGYSLDVFVVDGWQYEETQHLRSILQKEVQKLEKGPWAHYELPSPRSDHKQAGTGHIKNYVEIPNDGTDVWEIDLKQLKFGNQVASGAYGDLYKGTYCSQEVAIKVLKPECINTDLQKEFAQEVYIMRKVRHKHVVQFIGAYTKPPTLCIVTGKGFESAYISLPYEYLTPLQAAVGVVQKGLRPIIPKTTPLKLSQLLERCWQQDPTLRPDFSEILEILPQMAKEVGVAEDRHKEKPSGFFSALRRGHH